MSEPKRRHAECSRVFCDYLRLRPDLDVIPFAEIDRIKAECLRYLTARPPPCAACDLGEGFCDECGGAVCDLACPCEQWRIAQKVKKQQARTRKGGSKT